MSSKSDRGHLNDYVLKRMRAFVGLRSRILEQMVGIEDHGAIGELICAFIGGQCVYRTKRAFALVTEWGEVVTWGDAEYGGDSSDVAAQLGSGVQSVFETSSAFFAVKADGSVVAWGGMASSAVAAQLSGGIRNVVGNRNGFAAVKADGSVVTWGKAAFGADSSAVAAELSGGVLTVVANEVAFAAVKSDGAVVTWGDAECGGDSSVVAVELSSGGVTKVVGTDSAFAAVKADGSVVTWGNKECGGDSSAEREELSSGVETVVGNDYAFAAVKKGGGVVAWGRRDSGGDVGDVGSQLQEHVRHVVKNRVAFAALKVDGSVVTWGRADCGALGAAQADNSWQRTIMERLAGNVERVVSTRGAFAALKRDGSVVTWGAGGGGADSLSVDGDLLGGVKSVVGNGYAFAAIKSDGSVVRWGNNCHGGAVWEAVAEQLSGGVQAVIGNSFAFAAVKEDGAVVTWGKSTLGGDSRCVVTQLSGVAKQLVWVRDSYDAFWNLPRGGLWDSACARRVLLAGGKVPEVGSLLARAARRLPGFAEYAESGAAYWLCAVRGERGWEPSHRSTGFAEYARFRECLYHRLDAKGQSPSYRWEPWPHSSPGFRGVRTIIADSTFAWYMVKSCWNDVHDFALYWNDVLVARVICQNNGVFGGDVGTYVRAVFGGHKFSMPAVVPIWRSVREDKRGWFDLHGFFQTVMLPDVRATPALLDFEAAYRKATGFEFYCGDDWHVKDERAFKGVVGCVLGETWDLLLCIGWNATSPLAEFKAQAEFLREHS